MKRLFALLLLFLPLSVHATTTVTGHITDLSGSAATSSFVRFTLRGCGGNQPTVNGTAIFAPTQGSVWYKDFPANATGDISGTIYSTRDVTGNLGGDITCGSSTTAVWYGMTVWQAGKSGPEVAVHAKNTATLNVTSVIPLSTTPVVTAPSGDTTYLRIDTSNSPLTGNLTSTGTISDAGGSHSGTETFGIIGSSQISTIANSPTGATQAGNIVTITTTTPCIFTTGEAVTIAGVGVTAYNGNWIVLTPGCNGGSTFTYNDTTNGLAASGGGTVTGTPNFTGGLTASGPISMRFNGPSPWIDIMSPQYGAKCDGATDDTAAVQSALNDANRSRTQRGGTIFIPPNIFGTCIIASSLDMHGMVGVTVRGNGFTSGSLGGNDSQASLRFTGTCNPNPCLNLRSTGDLSFEGVIFSFPNATLGPMVDLSRDSVLLTDSSRLSFHGCAFVGPGVTIGPIILDQNTDEVLFDDWTLFTKASVFVEGPLNNAAGFSDKTVFRTAQFYQPGTVAVQNVSVNWTFNDCLFLLGLTGNPGMAGISYVGGYTNQQNLVMIGNEFLISGTNANTVISLPAVSGNNGGSNIYSNLFVGAPNVNLIAISIGNNNSTNISGNVYSGIGTTLSVGTGVAVNVGPNIYSSITTFMSGTPQNGTVLDNTGATSFYSGTNLPLKIINASVNVAGAFLPTAAGTPDVGSTALPFGNLWLGTAATNNFKFQPAATAASRIVSIPDPGAASTLALDASSTYVPATNVFTGAWICTNVTPVTANANVATDQNLMACTIPAGTLNRVGRTLRVWLAGVYTTPAASVSQMTVKVKLCTVSGCGSGTVITPISIQSTALASVQVTNDNWSIEERSTTQTAGASSAYEAHGDLLIDLTNLTTGADSTFGDTNTATVGTIDSTAQLFLQCTFAFSTASASNSVTQRQLIAETIN